MANMFDEANINLKMLTNPGMIQKNFCDVIAVGGRQITDPNNSVMLIMDAVAQTVAAFSQSTLQELNSTYPVRARVMADLYKSMSDYDYTAITATPASTTISIFLDKNYLIENAQDFNSDYKKVLIPERAAFKIGGYDFGLYYPVEIKINKRSEIFTVSYDVAQQNPLFSLVSDFVNFDIVTVEGLDLLRLTIPIYQFRIYTQVEATSPSTGFKKTYTYNQDEKFYVARVFNTVNGVKTEMATTLTNDIYNTSTPTIKVLHSPETREITLSIPEIYFTQNQIGTLDVWIYLTQGALDVPISQTDGGNITADWSVSTYSAVLKAMTTRFPIIPVDGRIIGGKNTISFDELKMRVVNNSLYDKIPITNVELANAFADQGFSIRKDIDNITNRRYTASRKMVNSVGETIPVTFTDIRIDTIQVPNVESILRFTDGSLTLLPTTIYSFNPSLNVCIPIIDSEKQRLKNLSAENLAEELNTFSYTRTPYHTVLYTDDKYPLAKTFNLASPSLVSLKIVQENPYTSYQISVVNIVIIHEGNGTGGFKVRFAVRVQGDRSAIREEDFYLIMQTTNSAGTKLYKRATYFSTINGLLVYEAILNTVYQITQDRKILMELNETPTNTVYSFVDLESTFNIITALAPRSAPAVQNDPSILNGLPSEFNGFFGLYKQIAVLRFGEDLSSGLYNRTTVSNTGKEYMTHPEDVYATYDHDVPKKIQTGVDGDGKPIFSPDYSVSNGNVIINIEHKQGDFVLDAGNNKVLKHAKGSVVRDENGQPIVRNQSRRIYSTATIMLDGKLFASNAKVDTDYIANIPTEIAAYIANVSNMNSILLEQTRVYFEPVRSMGETIYGIGDGAEIQLPLGLGFTIRFFVPIAVHRDDVRKESIRQQTVRTIESHMTKPVISLTGIAAELRSVLLSDITSIDVLGINGNLDLQTLIILEKGIEPMVAKKLSLNPDGSLSLVKDITVEFIADSVV